MQPHIQSYQALDLTNILFQYDDSKESEIVRELEKIQETSEIKKQKEKREKSPKKMKAVQQDQQPISRVETSKSKLQATADMGPT